MKGKRKPKWLVRYYRHGWWWKPREKQTEFTKRYFNSRDEALGFATRAVIEDRTAGADVVDVATQTTAYHVYADIAPYRTSVKSFVKNRFVLKEPKSIKAGRPSRPVHRNLRRASSRLPQQGTGPSPSDDLGIPGG